MRGLYESLLDDEATILSRSDRDADLLMWSEVVFGSGMLNKGQFRIKPGSTAGKFKLEYFGKEYTPIPIKFLSEGLYKQFSEACEGIYIYALTMIEMMIGFDFDFNTLPHFYDLEGDGYDDPFRTGTTHINLTNYVYTLRNLNPENLGINKKTSQDTTLKIFNSMGCADVTFKNFRWDVPYAKVMFENIRIKNTKHIDLSVEEITASNVDVDRTADDETKKIGILSHLSGFGNNIMKDKISFSNGVLKLTDKSISYDVHGSLSNIGIKDIIGDGICIYGVLDKDVHLISRMKLVRVAPDDSDKIEFDNYRSKPKIRIYSLQRVFGNKAPNMNFRAWCDISQDKENWNDWDDVSSLNFVFYAGRGALDCVYSNCMLIRFAEASSQIVTDIQRLLKKHSYISDDELKTVFPLDNFNNLKFIVWNAGSGEGIVKTPKGWHKK